MEEQIKGCKALLLSSSSSHFDLLVRTIVKLAPRFEQPLFIEVLQATNGPARSPSYITGVISAISVPLGAGSSPRSARLASVHRSQMAGEIARIAARGTFVSVVPKDSCPERSYIKIVTSEKQRLLMLESDAPISITSPMRSSCL
ncbi:hypothetical protein RRG08_047443 [Elysia crispata]|uniref:Uncharacterized protein n=1 Tax=Elysia crispata TaxID=231223 RepID=A0AAE0YUG8_9GAST|nr:hypothetical protein RRG08_047443 [Elysia crispata]